jgi:putative ABC transport system permease protein
MRYFRQALALMREEKLYSAMYIAGTALAVAFVMLIAEVYYVRVADIEPESRRSKTYVLTCMEYQDKSTEMLASITHDVYRDLFQRMQAPEEMMAVMPMYSGQGLYIKLADRKHDREVNMKQTEPRFFRFFDLRFVEGAPFTKDDFDAGRNMAVITEELRDLIFGHGQAAVGKSVSIGNIEWRVCGVVETPSVLMEQSAADVYVSYSAEGVNLLNASDWHGSPLTLYFSVPSSRRAAFMDELKAVEARYNAVHRDRPVDVTARLTTYHHQVLESFGYMFPGYGESSYWWLTPVTLLLLLLIVPALNLSGMVASRMERRLPEMAIRKAFGAKRRWLLSQVVAENMVLTLMGGFVGLCLAWTALYGWRDWVFYILSDNRSLYAATPIIRGEMLFGPAIFLVALMVCMVLNVLAATVPAWWSLKKPIVESMMLKK